MKGHMKGKKFIPTGKSSTKGVSSDTIGYNVKLKMKEKIRDPKRVVLKNGRHAIAGVGSDGTKMFKFVKA